MKTEIDKFVGNWVNDEGCRLVIEKGPRQETIVSFVSGKTGFPIARPYYDDLPSTNMVAELSDCESSLEVELWCQDKGFTLHLTYEQSYDLDNEQRNSLVPTLSRYECDDFLDQYFLLFGHLGHYIRSGRIIHRTKKGDTCLDR